MELTNQLREEHLRYSARRFSQMVTNLNQEKKLKHRQKIDNSGQDLPDQLQKFLHVMYPRSAQALL